MNREVKLGDGAFSVFPDTLCNEIKKTDLIIIPALFGDMKNAVDQNRALIPWIVEQHARGAEVASLCVGAFLLASTGLLEGKKCSTHWAYYNEFRETFPAVEMVDGSIITEDHGIYSMGVSPVIFLKTPRNALESEYPTSNITSEIFFRDDSKHLFAASIFTR